jgi:hypothetical protein
VVRCTIKPGKSTSSNISRFLLKLDLIRLKNLALNIPTKLIIKPNGLKINLIKKNNNTILKMIFKYFY